MVSPAGYRILSYGDMITDRPRMRAYAEALRRTVRPGAVVLDIGAGTGIFSLLACQFGAGQVHAVEPHDAIAVARAVAVANGYADRILFHQGLSTAIELPQPADVIVSDLRGVLPLFQRHIPTVVDARQRLLARGGALIPRRDRLWTALVEHPTLYRPYNQPWRENDYGLDLSPGRPLAVNSWVKASTSPEQLLVRPRHWVTLDYAHIEQARVAGNIVWTADRAGNAHGLIVWFDTELADGIGFSNAPGQPELIYGQAFFPLEEPVALAQGDAVAVSLRADLVDDDYVWRWSTRVTAQGGAGSIKASFRQSSFQGVPLSLARLKQREAGFVPSRMKAAQVDQLVLSMMDGATSLGEIAAALAARFPQRFRGRQAALTHVADLVQRYRS